MPGYREISPPPPLLPLVACFWVWEASGKASPHRVLPDGCIDFLFSIRSWGRRCELRVIGPMTRYLDVPRADVTLLLGVRFRPAGAVPFLDCPALDIVDSRPSLEDLWGAQGASLRERLAGARTVEERLRILEANLVERLERGRREPLVEEIVAHMYRAGGALSVSSLASDFDLSVRQIRRRFEAAVGLTPKFLLRIIRLQNVLREARRRSKVDWAELALEAGFYDQAHFINDFRAWTGMSPASYFRC